jgi:acetyl esterase/lipase
MRFMMRGNMGLQARWTILLLLCAGVFVSASAQHTVLPLYPGVAPGSEGKPTTEKVRTTPDGEHVYSGIHQPSITLYLPAGNATSTAILVIPGGGHSEVWADHEGFNVADWLSAHGIAAFVLKYRLAREPGSTYTVEGTELDDAQRAMRLIRSHAKEWKIDPARLGVIGFSAGGELAALVATRSDMGKPDASDPVAQQSSKPAFQALMYPSIPKDMALSKDTPPAFLACGANDAPRVSEGVPQLYLTMKHAGTPVEMHVFAGFGHGFGIRAKNPANVIEWPVLFYSWLESSGFLKP